MSNLIVDPKFVAEQFKGYGGTVLSTSLTEEQDAKLQKVLASTKSAA